MAFRNKDCLLSRQAGKGSGWGILTQGEELNFRQKLQDAKIVRYDRTEGFPPPGLFPKLPSFVRRLFRGNEENAERGMQKFYEGRPHVSAETELIRQYF